ncbi:hypothetical protein PLESTM_000565000 [Pleodorina starrii]|nr:hypothetical protein PLESTM_000565000 [Pleodorina starrii]
MKNVRNANIVCCRNEDSFRAVISGFHIEERCTFRNSLQTARRWFDLGLGPWRRKGGVSTATYRGINNTVSKVLGFAFSCLAIPMAYISLRLFSNQDILVKFTDFMVKRWGCNHALAEITRLVKVVAYLKHKDAGGQPPSPDSAAKVGHCGRLVGWLHNIQCQLRLDYPTAPPQAPQPAAGEGGGGAGEDEGDADDNGLPSMSEVLSFVMTLRCRADRVLARDLGVLGSGPVSYEAAVLQMHALLTEFLSGVYMPPMRMSSLCTLMVPGQDTCQEQDCGRQGCRGNNLMDAREPSLADRPPPPGPASSSKRPQPSLPDPALISSNSGRRLVVEITHHKTEHFSRNQPPLRLVLPAELSSSVRQYVQYTRPVLMHRAAREDHDAPPYLLISRNGAPFAWQPRPVRGGVAVDAGGLRSTVAPLPAPEVPTHLHDRCRPGFGAGGGGPPGEAAGRRQGHGQLAPRMGHTLRTATG